MTTQITDKDRAYLDLAFTPLKAAIERADTAEIARIVAQLKADGRQDLADIALDTAVQALYPQGTCRDQAPAGYVRGKRGTRR